MGSSRSSTEPAHQLASAPTWAFFGVPAPYLDFDPHVLYDAAHGRWVASIVVRYPDDTDNYTLFGISETTDPLGAWDDYFVGYGESVPDFPGLASSTDKIVLTANEYFDGDYSGASIFAVTWASLLGGGFDYGFSDPDPSLFSIRPARIVGTSADVQLVAEGVDTVSVTQAGHVMYKRFTGAATAASTSGFVDITTGGPALDSFADDSAIVAPRQTGSDTIAQAVDGRPTDAVWRANSLWFVSTVTGDPGSGTVDEVRVTRIVTGTGIPSAGATVVIATDGIDSYMGGIGVSGDGTPFATWTTSSPSADPAAHFATLTGDALGTTEDLDTSDAAYAGEHWGGYVGVSADPLAAGAAWIVGETAAGDGTWRTTIVRALVDTAPPSAPGTPTESIVVPATLGDTLATRVSWAAATDPGSGVARYRILTNETPPLQPATGFGSLATTITTSFVRPLLLQDKYAFQIAAVDGAGSVGPASTGAAFTPTLYATPSLSVTGTWHTSSSSAFIAGSTRYSSAKNATATFSFTGRAVAFASYKSTTRGSVKIYVDNVYRGTISLYSTTAKKFQLVFAQAWATSGAHKVKLVVVGTKGHARIDADGFVVLK